MRRAGTAGSTGCAFVIGILAGCSPGGAPAASPNLGDVLTFRGDAARTGEMPGHGPGASAITLWRHTQAASITAAPLVLDGHVIVVGHDGVVRGLALDTGLQAWEMWLAAGVSTTPTIDGRDLNVVGNDGVLRVLSLDGHDLRWEAGGFLPQSIVTASGSLLLAGRDGELTALATADGQEIWRAPAGGSDRAAVSGDVAYASGEGSGSVTAVGVDGAEHWRFETGGPWVVTPAVIDDIVYVGTRDVPGDRNVVLALRGGAEQWRWAPASRDRINGHAVTNDHLFVATERPSAAVHALDRRTGETAWVHAFDDRLISVPTVAAGVVYVAGDQDGIAALDAATGELLWRGDIGSVFEAAIAVSDGLLVVTATGSNAEGRVIAFAAPDDPRVPAGSGSIPSASARPPLTASPSPPPMELIRVDTIEGPSLPLAIAVAPDGTTYVGDMANSRVVVRLPDGTIDSWGERGTLPGQFNFSEVTQNDASVGVAISPDGELIAVGDGGNHRVQVFDSSRRLLRSIGRLGRGDGQFLNPGGVAVDSSHRVWVVDVARADVQVFDEIGQFELRFAGPGSGNGQLRRPGPPVVDEVRGEVLIPDFANRRVAVFSLDGKWLRNSLAPAPAGVVVGEINGVAVDRFGRLFAVDTPANNLFIVDRSGEVTATLPPVLPDGRRVEFASFALDDDGGLHFADIWTGRLISVQLGPPIWPPD